MAAEHEAAAEAAPVGRDFALLIAKNELVPSNRKQTASAENLEGLVAELVSSLGLGEGGFFLSLPVAEGEQPVPLESLDDVKSKAKLQIWRTPSVRDLVARSTITAGSGPPSPGAKDAAERLGGAEDPKVAAAAAAKARREEKKAAKLAAVAAADAAAVPEGVPPTEVPEGVPPAAAEAREFALLLVKNELVPSNRKVAASATDLGELIADLVKALRLPEGGEYFVSPSGADGEVPVAVTSLDELKAKAKLQIWEASDAPCMRPPFSLGGVAGR